MFEKDQHILVTGGTGFIGQSLVLALLEEGYGVTLYVRNLGKAQELYGQDVSYVTDLAQIKPTAQINGVINLAGESIIGGFWTKKRRQTLRDSRLLVTQAVVDLIARLQTKPEFLISGSAIGYYGDQPEKLLTEADLPAEDFAATLCKDWEEVALKAENYRVRVVRLRIGVVLGADGGAFPALLRPVKFGMGAILGTGQQWVSWIHKQDLIRLIGIAMSDRSLNGAVNATAPVPVRQKELVKFMSQHLQKPQFISVPSKVLSLTLGEMSVLFLGGQFVRPEKISAKEFEFYYPRIEFALENLVP